jgi:hypothetical protein
MTEVKDDYHALFSPSKAAMLIACPNALAVNQACPDTRDKKDADLGTDKHELLTLCLEFKKRAETYIGHVLKKGHKVDHAFAAEVQIVVDGVHERIKAYKETGATVSLEIEQDVPIDQITGEQGATGRADVVLLAEWPKRAAEICVIDAKFGYREVLPYENPQLMMYAHGAATKFSLVADFDTAILAIHQPALSETPREWATTMVNIEAWVQTVAGPAADTAFRIQRMSEERPLLMADFGPSDDACRYCNGKGSCPGQLAKVQEVLGDAFEVITKADEPDAALLSNDQLGEMWPWLDFLENYAKAVRGRIEYELLQGAPVKDCKLVEGKRGNRTWADDAEAEAMLKSFRLKQDQMYSFKLLGPKPILEVLKDQPRRVKKLAEMITQKDGKPHVAHISDPRPALRIEPVAEVFEPVESNDDLV